MKSSRMLIAAVAAAAATVCAPAAAQAAVSMTITGDNGQPAVISPAAAPTLRMMAIEATPTVPDADGLSYRYSVIGPDGIPAAPDNCWSSDSIGTRVAFRGNGTYTLTLSTYGVTGCAGAARATFVYKWTVAASVAIGQPAGPLPTRPANSFTTNAILLDFAGNPGAGTYEVRYAKGGVIGPDGGIAGVTSSAFVDTTTGKVRFSNFDGPGTYTFVARAQTGDFFTPWSAPANVTLIAPFDLSTANFSDRRGPSYQITGTVREKAAAGQRVTVAMAKGKNGKRYRTIGRARINSSGTFKLRFTQRRLGWYKMRFSFKGTSLVSRGTAYSQVRFRRTIS